MNIFLVLAVVVVVVVAETNLNNRRHDFYNHKTFYAPDKRPFKIGSHE